MILTFAVAVVVMVILSEDFSRFIDIFRKKPHFPDFDVLAVIAGAK